MIDSWQYFSDQKNENLKAIEDFDFRSWAWLRVRTDHAGKTKWKSRKKWISWTNIKTLILSEERGREQSEKINGVWEQL